MRNLYAQAKRAADQLTKANRSVMDRLVEPLAVVLEPHKDNLFVRNIPNAMSVLRCILAVVFDWQILQSTTYLGRWFWLLEIVGLMISDGIDGALARRLGIESIFGALADPFADKVLIGGLVIGLGVKFNPSFFAWLVAGLLIIEIGNMVAGFKGGQKARQLGVPKLAGASRWGKVKFGAECLLVLLGWILVGISPVALAVCLGLIILVIPLAVSSLIGYVAMIKTANSVLHSAKSPKVVVPALR